MKKAARMNPYDVDVLAFNLINLPNSTIVESAFLNKNAESMQTMSTIPSEMKIRYSNSHLSNFFTSIFMASIPFQCTLHIEQCRHNFYRTGSRTEQFTVCFDQHLLRRID